MKENANKKNIIKYLKTYQNKILSANDNDLPITISKLYSYLLRKNLIAADDLKKYNQYFLKEIIKEKINYSKNIILPKTRSLSKKQIKICELLAKGYSLKEISEKMNLKINTINKYISIIKYNYEVSSKQELLKSLLS